MMARLGTALRVFFFALLPAASTAGGLALAPLLAVAGAASLRPSLLRADLARPPLWLIFLVLLTAWLAISALWSPFGSAIQALKFAVTVGAGLLFARAASTDSLWTLSAAGAALITLFALLGFEAGWDMPLTRAASPEGLETWQIAGGPGRGAAVLVSMIWAGAGALILLDRPRLALAVLVGGGLLSFQFGQSANILAFAAGLGAFALALLTPSLAIFVTTTGVAAWLLIAPFAMPVITAFVNARVSLPYSWDARLEIWRYVTARIMEQPWLGHGLDASRVDDAVIQVQGQTTGAIPLHPHSASLQIWFELGAVGAVLAAACLIAGGWAMIRAIGRDRVSAAAACGTLASIAAIANLSFGAWQEWWNAVMVIAAALICALAACRARLAG